MLFGVIESLRNRPQSVVIVFGGGRGIGEAVARGFAVSGFRVVVVSRTPVELRRVANDIGGRAIVADIADATAVARVFSECGPVDAVVNAAAVQGGAGAIGELWRTRPESFAEVVKVNLLGSYHVLRESILSMGRHGIEGSIVLFSGGGSSAPRKRLAAYGTSKTAVLRMVEDTALELRETGSGIRVFAIAPGPVHTAMTEEVLRLQSLAGGEEVDMAVATVSGLGLPATLAARLCRFLVGPHSASLSGRLIHANEDYETYARHDLTDASGCLRRLDYEPRSDPGHPLRDQPCEP